MKTIKALERPGTHPLELTLGDQNAEVATELASAFSGVPAVEVVCGNLLDVECDAIVSPANSFGDMGGGIDKAIDDLHDGEAQRRITAAIAREFLGELPVGAALVVEMDESRIPFVVVAPTMRVPGAIAGSMNAYLAMRAALVAVRRHNEGNRPIRRLAVSGLGTGVGGISFAEAAAQMRTAYASVIEEQWRNVVSPALAPYALHGLKKP